MLWIKLLLIRTLWLIKKFWNWITRKSGSKTYHLTGWARSSGVPRVYNSEGDVIWEGKQVDHWQKIYATFETKERKIILGAKDKTSGLPVDFDELQVFKGKKCDE
jgi:hypothetical protein